MSFFGFTVEWRALGVSAMSFFGFTVEWRALGGQFSLDSRQEQLITAKISGCTLAQIR
jgi:hypothetical protein